MARSKDVIIADAVNRTADPRVDWNERVAHVEQVERVVEVLAASPAPRRKKEPWEKEEARARQGGKRDAAAPPPQRPARLRPGQLFVEEGALLDKDGKGNPKPNQPVKHYRNVSEHPLTLAFYRGQLSCGDTSITPENRRDAGDIYRGLAETLGRSGRDSTDLGGGGGATGVTLSAAQQEAGRMIAAIDAGLSAKDLIIIRSVCGLGMWPSEAVREACGRSYDKATIPRLNEALDSLVIAIARARTKRPAAPTSPSNKV